MFVSLALHQNHKNYVTADTILRFPLGKSLPVQVIRRKPKTRIVGFESGRVD